jgi:hypothetical protein
MWTWLLVLLVPAVLGLLVWIRRRRRRPAELPATPYVCHRCNEKDCHCDPLN